MRNLRGSNAKPPTAVQDDARRVRDQQPASDFKSGRMPAPVR